MLTIRPHKPADAAAIGIILADGWKQAYSSFMPAERLKTHADRAYRIAEIEAFLDGEYDPVREALLVAETDRVVGFAYLLPADSGQGVVSLLYVDPEAQRGGVGRALVRAAADWFAVQALAPVRISAFAENPFAGFYLRIGGTEVERQNHEVMGKVVVSVIYAWSDAAALRKGAEG
jgi:GNAT superfamily N-acetyltransferase